MSLIDYLYIDRQRLDAYFEQVSGTVAFDKVPEWTASLAMDGPKVEGKQTRHPRPYSPTEKIRAVLKHLLARSSMIERDSATIPPFGFETLEAVKVVIPPKENSSGDLVGVVLWLSGLEYRGNRLILIESLRAKDRDFVDSLSQQTTLLQFLSEVSQEFEHSAAYHPLLEALECPLLFVLPPGYQAELEDGHSKACSAELRREFNRNGARLNEISFRESLVVPWPHTAKKQWEVRDGAHRYLVVEESSQIDGIRKIAGYSVFQNHRAELAAQFAAHPAEFLNKLGASIAPPRTITSLYRVRSSLLEGTLPDDYYYQIGYPIFIADGRVEKEALTAVPGLLRRVLSRWGKR